MNVTCAECASVFRVDPGKVPSAGVRARCAVCGAIMAVHRSAQDAPAPLVLAGAALGDDVLSAGAQDHALAGSTAAPDALAASAFEVAALDAAPAVAVRPPTELPPPTEVRAAESPPGLPAAEVLEPIELLPPPPPEDTPAIAPAVSTPAAPTASPAEPPSATGVPGPGLDAPSRVGPRIAPRPDTPASGAIGPARRVNPYLANDPSQRARRLARALVSDLVAYHPDRREEGIRAGTLKALFRDEIRKSWEEYVAQVGASTAESTTHFQDALNDILAGGRKVF